MKTSHTAFFLLLLLLFAVCSCNSLNDTEKHVVGTWDSSYSEEYDMQNEDSEWPWIYALRETQESTDEFRSDGTEVEEGTSKFKFTLDFSNVSHYYYAVLEYRFRYEGEWSVDGDYLHVKGKSLSYEFVDAYFMGEMDDLDEEYYLEQLKELQEIAILEQRRNIMIPRKQKILYLSDSELKVQFDDGSTLTEVRIE